MTLECYKKMYAKLCAAASDAIDLLDHPNNSLYVKISLEKALLDAEELYLSSEARYKEQRIEER